MSTLRTPPVLTGIYRGLPENYPIFHTFLSGKRQQLCAEPPTNLHTFGERKALCASYSSIIPGYEPRALLHTAQSGTVVHVSASQCDRYTQGG